MSEKKLKPGFTTGSASAAAAKGALALLLKKKSPAQVQIVLLTGDSISIPIHTCQLETGNSAVCTVIKDAGDDPDITHKAEIGARVTLLEDENSGNIFITRGKGVGLVTKPGLEIPPGEPAINPGPRKMIFQALQELLPHPMALKVEIFVPQGEELAKNTLNSRLGILGGISILGTTGIVKPLSHEAYIASIQSAISVARAMDVEELVFTTGRRSERYAQNLWQELPQEAFIQIGDFFKASLEIAGSLGVKEIRLAVFFGKAVKMAQGIPHTHAAKSSLTLHKLADWAYEITQDKDLAEKILSANTARHAFDLLGEDNLPVFYRVGREMIAAAQRFSGENLEIKGVIFGYHGNLVFHSMDG